MVECLTCSMVAYSKYAAILPKFRYIFHLAIYIIIYVYLHRYLDLVIEKCDKEDSYGNRTM